MANCAIPMSQLAKDICMQIAAANPTYLNKEQVPADVQEKLLKAYTDTDEE